MWKIYLIIVLPHQFPSSSQCNYSPSLLVAVMSKSLGVRLSYKEKKMHVWKFLNKLPNRCSLLDVLSNAMIYYFFLNLLKPFCGSVGDWATVIQEYTQKRDVMAYSGFVSCIWNCEPHIIYQIKSKTYCKAWIYSITGWV